MHQPSPCAARAKRQSSAPAADRDDLRAPHLWPRPCAGPSRLSAPCAWGTLLLACLKPWLAAYVPAIRRRCGCLAGAVGTARRRTQGQLARVAGGRRLDSRGWGGQRHHVEAGAACGGRSHVCRRNIARCSPAPSSRMHRPRTHHAPTCSVRLARRAAGSPPARGAAAACAPRRWQTGPQTPRAALARRGSLPSRRSSQPAPWASRSRPS